MQTYTTNSTLFGINALCIQNQLTHLGVSSFFGVGILWSVVDIESDCSWWCSIWGIFLGESDWRHRCFSVVVVGGGSFWLFLLNPGLGNSRWMVSRPVPHLDL